jgi:hypothetical protein
VLDAVERGLRLGVLDLEPRYDERSRPIGADDEPDRPLGRHECEARVVENVVGVEEHDARQSGGLRALEKRIAAGAMLLRRDRDRRDHRSGA